MVLDELAAYIHVNAVGMTFTPTMGTTMFAGRRAPDLPDGCVSLVEYPGRKGERTHRSGGYYVWEHPHVQIIVRDTAEAGGYDNARGNAEILYTTLQKVKNMALSGVFYAGIEPMQPPFELQPDKKDRPYYGFNIECKKYLSE